MKKATPGIKSVAVNKKARREYELSENIEAGLELVGSEVKSLRDGKVSFKDGYVRFADGEAWLVGVHIAPYEFASAAALNGHDPERPRKLLLHKHQIKMLMNQVEQKGMTVVPLKIYFKNGRAKLEIALGRGKKLYDRREDLKRRAADRDAARELVRH